MVDRSMENSRILGEQIGKAVGDTEVFTAARLLEDLGACGWEKGMADSQKGFFKSQWSKLRIEASLDGDRETITIFRMDAAPVVSVTQPRCKK
jgi:hypothetical protein